jgi:hypothetical protein
MAGKKKLMRFSEFVARRSDKADLLAEGAEVIEAGIQQAIFSIVDGDKSYEERKAIIDRVCCNLLSFSEGGGQVVVMIMAVR